MYVKNTNSLCNFNISTPISSTKRDVIFLYASRFNPGLELAIKSLRSTGTLCRVILFTPKSAAISRFHRKFLLSLDVEIISDLEELNNRSYVPHMLRYECEQKWLQANIKDVSRILHSDSYDVFFQGDPFAFIPLSGELIFVVEPHCFRSCGWNLAWITECFDRQTVRSMLHRYIICSGSIAGGPKSYLKLLSMMIGSKEWSKCWDTSKDQPILNYLVWSGAVARDGIEYRMTGCNGGFFTSQWCVINHEVRFNSNGQIASTAGAVPSFIHQYNREGNLTTRLYRACSI